MHTYRTSSRKLIQLFAVAAISLVASTATHADPIIVSGIATVFKGLPSVAAEAHLTGPNFSANVTTLNGGFGLAPCSSISSPPGCTSANLSWVSVGSDLIGSVTLNGMTFPTNAQNQLFLMFSSVTFVIPPEFLGPSDILVTAPFTFVGGFSREGVAEVVALQGEGTVRLLLARRTIGGFDGLFIDHADYIFGPRTPALTIEPVPEPMTILLFASGIAGMLVRLKKPSR